MQAKTDKTHVEKHVRLPGFTDQWFLGEKKPLLHWPTVAPDNLGERSLNIIQNRPAERMGNRHTQIWIFTPVHQSLGLFQSFQHMLKICTKPGAWSQKIFDLLKNSEKKKKKNTHIFFLHSL